ncbi:MAG TPA: antitoxin MazE family protein [Acidisphaera sp.]|nr:antitoxin MazE family protein [Acidisphaera sp.]
MSDASRDRVRRHREALRKQGLRPVQIWVRDTRAPGFVEEARRQMLAVAEAERREGLTEWVEEVSALNDPDAAW